MFSEEYNVIFKSINKISKMIWSGVLIAPLWSILSVYFTINNMAGSNFCFKFTIVMVTISLLFLAPSFLIEKIFFSKNYITNLLSDSFNFDDFMKKNKLPLEDKFVDKIRKLNAREQQLLIVTTKYVFHKLLKCCFVLVFASTGASLAMINGIFFLYIPYLIIALLLIIVFYPGLKKLNKVLGL